MKLHLRQSGNLLVAICIAVANNPAVVQASTKLAEVCLNKSSTTPVADEKDELTRAQEALNELKSIYSEAAQVINQAKDEESAKKIKPRLAELSKRFDETGKLLRSLKLSKDQQKGLMLMYQEKMEPAKEATSVAYKKLLAERPAAYRILSDLSLIKIGEENIETMAQLDINSIKRAITAYYESNQSWPPSLESLKKFYDGSINDPWGQPYNFEIVNVTGDKDASKYQPYVWAISKFGDGKKVIGTMPPKK